MKHRQVGLNRTGVVNTDGHTIGLDIGATCVRAAVLAPGMLEGRRSVTIHGSGSVPLPNGTVVNGSVQEPAALTAAIKQLWAEAKFDCKNVIVGVANQQVMVRDMSIPNLDAAQRAKALPYQAKQIVALPIEQVLLDFCELEEPTPDMATVRGLLVATPREPVVVAVTAVEKAGLRVARVDLASFGMLRAAGDEALDVEAIVDLGAHLTTIVIHDRGVPKLVRTLARGGDAITDALADKTGLDSSDAEIAKRENGLNGPNEDVSRALIESLRPLVAEVRSSIGYHRANDPSAEIERITLTGGGAAMRGLVAALADQVGLPVRLADPLQHVRNRLAGREVRDVGFESPSVVALGLAMGAAA